MLKFSGFADLTSSQGKAIRSGDKVGSKIHAAAQQVASRWILLVARVRNTSMHCMRQRPDTRRCNAQTRSSHETTRGGACGWHEMMMRLKQACFQGYPESAVCVQIPIGSRSSAIHNAYHTSLRPSSLFEPRHPSLKVVWKLWHKASKEKTPHVDTTWFEHGLAASQPRVAPHRGAALGQAEQRPGTRRRWIRQCSTCHHPAAPWRTGRSIQSSPGNSTSASSHETMMDACE